MQKILITTRPAVKAADGGIFSSCLRVVNCHLTRVRYRMNGDDLLESLDSFMPSTIVFTSSIASVFALKKLPPRALSGRGIYCIGDSSAAPFIAAGYSPLVPDHKDSAGLAALVLSHSVLGQKIAVIRSTLGSDVFRKRLEAVGMEVKEIKLYSLSKSIDPAIYEYLCSRELAGVLVTSSLEARILSGILDEIECGLNRDNIRFFAIGRPTRDELEGCGIKVSPPLGNSDVRRLVSEIEKMLC